MGKKNLFKEAVKDTESEGTATSEAEKDPKWMQAKAAWEKLTGKKFDQMPTAQKISISQKVLKPAASKGYLENPRTKERTPISGGQQSTTQQAPVQQPIQQTTAQQPSTQVTTNQIQPQQAPSNAEIEAIKKELEELKALIQSRDQDEENIQEKINIAKFLKCLSEKNYFIAKKHLNKIVDNKVKRKISEEIK